jgi:PKHD-type hydroxylase
MADPLGARPLIPRGTAPAYAPYEVVPGVFTGPQCERIIGLGERTVHEVARLEDDTGARGDAGVRDAEVAWIPFDETTAWIFTKLASVTERVNRRYGFELTGFDEDLQFTVYDRPGSFYTWHQDGLDGPVAYRKLSLVVQLSDPTEYDGAALEFFGSSADLEGVELEAAHAECARRGSVIAFPSFEYHRVLPLRSGIRRSLVSWVSGPRLR